MAQLQPGLGVGPLRFRPRQGDACQRLDQRPDPTGGFVFDLHLGPGIGPGAPVQRHHPVLEEVAEIEKGGVRGRIAAIGEPAVGHPAQDPAGDVQGQRAFGANRPSTSTSTLGGAPGWKPATSRVPKVSRARWPSRAGSRDGPPDRPKRAPSLFEPAQQLEEAHAFGRGQIPAQIRARLPGVIGHDTSSCLCMRWVFVRTKELIAA
jgi:hypothetical protein